MIDYKPLYFFIFFIISITLIIASYTDYKTRKVSLKTWYAAVYLALPLSLIPLANQIWDGYININNPIQTFGVIYPLFIIGFLFILSSYSKTVQIGGADVIAITIILITSIPMGLDLPISYILFFIIFSIISLIITFSLKKWRDFKIPLIIPISFAYFVATSLYLLFGYGAGSII
jgi:hypothetical protein